jgi:peroxiredoxin (alkyl hydroperoxide reductase subunit C)
MKKGGGIMTEACECMTCNIGTMVPEFEIETYEPAKGDFGRIGLAELKKHKKWGILLFYPADFTFV